MPRTHRYFRVRYDGHYATFRRGRDWDVLDDRDLAAQLKKSGRAREVEGFPTYEEAAQAAGPDGPAPSPGDYVEVHLGGRVARLPITGDAVRALVAVAGDLKALLDAR